MVRQIESRRRFPEQSEPTVRFVSEERRSELLEMNHSWVRAAVVLWAVLVFASCRSNTGTASLINRAEEPISRATLTMSWGETLEVTNLDPSQSATINYRVKEGDYRVEVVFRSGKRLTTDTFYVTSGVDWQDQVIVTASEIQVIHNPVDSR